MIKRGIAIFTGNRAEYGLQYPIIKAIDRHPDLEYFLLVSGSHLQEDFGLTKDEILKDGFSIYKEVVLKMDQDNLFSTAQAIGSGILNISRILYELAPDFLVVYADRYEGLSALVTSTQMNIPTAHIEGGDLTEGGALDDSVRHAMTKLAHLHFCTNEQARKRILKLGEEPWRIHNIGYPGIDLMAEGNYANPNIIREKYEIDLTRPIVVFTQHSVTTEYLKAGAQIQPSVDALKLLAKEGIQIIITYPNSDAGGKRIITELEKLRAENISGISVHKSLGRYNYHGILNICGREAMGVCVGNSSSGIKETPYFGCPAVNIGSRQDGRLRSTNVIDVDYNKDDIVFAIMEAIYNKELRKQINKCENPYGYGGSGFKVAKILSEVTIDQKLIKKKMTY